VTEPIPFRRRLATNTLASMATNVWTIVLSLASVPIVLHGLGARGFGVWAFVQTLSANSGWLSVPATGLSIASTREVASCASDPDPTALRRSAGTTFLVFIVAGGLFGIVVTALLAGGLDRAIDLDRVDLPSLRVLAVAFGVQVLAEHVCLAITSVLEGQQQVALARLIDASRKTTTAVVVAVVASTDGGLQGVAVASAAGAVIATAVALVVLLQRRMLLIGRPGRASVRAMVSYAVPVSALTGTGVLHRTMDRTIAGVVLGPTAVALVEIANQIQGGSTALLSASTYPVLSSAPWLEGRGDRVALRSLFERSTRYSVLLTIPVSALAIALAGPFITTWIGSDFTEAIGLTQVAVAYVFVVAPLQAGSNLLQGVGRAGTVLWASSASVLVNLVVSLVLVHTVGLVGVFLGTIAGALVLLPLLVRATGRELGVPIGPVLVRAGATALLPAAVGAGTAGLVQLLGLDHAAALVVGGGLGVAAAGLAALRWSISRSERHELVQALRRRPATPP
jgi:O-antigen/teichoic acid export membrane protein